MKVFRLLPVLLFAAAPLLGDAPSLATNSDTSRENWAVDNPVMLPPVRIDGSRVKGPPLLQYYLKMDQMFKGPFLELRGGQLIEAIVWRHGFLRDHPAEKASILVRCDKNGRVVSATTIYSEDGKLYASNQVVGTHFRLRGLAAADIGRTAKISATIDGIRENYENVTEQDLAQWRTGGDWGPALAPPMAVLQGSGSQVDFGDALGAAYNVDGNVMDLMGEQMALAEETGDYSHVAVASAAGVAPNPFAADPALILARSYSALHDPAMAGLVPVAQRVMPIPTSHAFSGGIIQAVGESKAEPTPVLVFDWEGSHYIYDPQRGTYGAPIPTDPLTGQPYLCITGGDLLESVNFCASYLKAHPGDKVVLIAPAGGPYGAVYTANGQLHYFSPFFGRADVPPRLRLSPDDRALNAKLLALLVDRERKRLAAAHESAESRLIPRSLAGDDKAMQAVRAYVALNAEGVPVRLLPGPDGATYTLAGNWAGTGFSQNF